MNKQLKDIKCGEIYCMNCPFKHSDIICQKINYFETFGEYFEKHLNVLLEQPDILNKETNVDCEIGEDIKEEKE